MTTAKSGPDRRLPYPDTGPEESPHVHEPPTRVRQGGHREHRLMMLVCCIPMLVIVVLLVATGAAGSAALLWAVGCVAMMAVMMFAMPGGHDHK